ncbi:MAG: caspase family protein [Spirochaetota bacterium]
MAAVVGKVEATGIRTVLVSHDSCRDNPFPCASRSGTRGLAVVASPRTLNSLTAYATSPGDLAQYGSGRNGAFSCAVIKQLLQPGLELTHMMKNVKAQVTAATGNKRTLRVDDGM